VSHARRAAFSPPTKIAYDQIFACFDVMVHGWLKIDRDFLVQLQFDFVEAIIACMEHFCCVVHRFLRL
jgi:hypothetical protein